MIKLDYFDLISRKPIEIENVGSIRCPLLSDIDDIKYYTYCSYIQALKITPDDFFDNLEEKYGIKVPVDQIMEITKFDLILSDGSLLIYRDATEFCILILYLATLPNLFISCNFFFGGVLRVFYR